MRFWFYAPSALIMRSASKLDRSCFLAKFKMQICTARSHFSSAERSLKFRCKAEKAANGCGSSKRIHNHGIWWRSRKSGLHCESKRVCRSKPAINVSLLSRGWHTISTLRAHTGREGEQQSSAKQQPCSPRACPSDRRCMSAWSNVA